MGYACIHFLVEKHIILLILLTNSIINSLGRLLRKLTILESHSYTKHGCS